MHTYSSPEIVSEPNRRTPPIELLAGAWLASYSSDNTRRAYRSDLRAWLTFCDHHDLPPLEARRSHVELFVRQLEQLGRAPATVARRLCGVSRWYAWLVDEEYLEYSPTIRVKRPRVPTESTRTWLGRLELGQWLDAAEGLGGDTYALSCLLAINALRIGEVCSANVSDLGRDRHHYTLKIMGKGGKPAVVPLTPRTAHALEAAVGDRTSGPLLLNRAGTRLNRESAGRAVRTIAKKALVKKHLTPHSLRHSAITAALNAGIDLRAVQQYARHADPATTIRYDRTRLTLDKHPAYLVDIHIAGGSL
jgi:integrase/recombinase XerD